MFLSQKVSNYLPTIIFTVTFQTPVLRKVNARRRSTQTSGFTTTIPPFTTEQSTYETGESSRRTKRSKRPTLQSRTPIVFNLDDDGHVRKVYDKYVGVSEGTTFCHYFNIITQISYLLLPCI